MAYDRWRDAAIFVGGEMNGDDFEQSTWELLADSDRDGMPDADDPCRSIRALSASCRAREDHWRIKGTCIADLPTETHLTLALDGRRPRLLIVPSPGARLRAKWTVPSPAPREVCILQCRGRSRCTSFACE